MKQALNHDRFSNPDQGVQQNSQWPAPFSGAAQVGCLCCSRAEAQVGRFREGRNLTLTRRSNCVHSRFAADLNSPNIWNSRPQLEF
jgi:hypothetical protein